MRVQSESSDPAIRGARSEDIPGVRALLVETWHDTYDALLGAPRVTEITDVWHSVEALGSELEAPRSSFLVCEQAGRIIGHILADAKGSVLLISRLYVHPAHQRNGVGGRLLARAAADHPAAELIRLEVEADNGKGLAFYRQEAFQPTGERTIEGIRHIVMEKAVHRSG